MEENLQFESWEEDTTKIETPCGSLYLCQGYGEKGHEKCFIWGLGKMGGCIPALLLGIQRLIARAFKNGATYLDIVEDLEKISCPNPTYQKGEKFDSCLALIASYYKEAREELTQDKKQDYPA